MHICPTISGNEAYFESFDNDIFLTISKIATEEDLENNHNLEHEGQVIEQVSIPVTFCPYCGERLTKLSVDVTEYEHYKFA
ncbi:hypothetical protein J9B83_15245 [Marinomonas sp. A79]|uniref:Uncharacterized protein n=1 Tax=Marinomonas vulgaris TaxID=2823372 RepID=A0ABS5HF37_9GAMM|nr:hypothetical protein [Marinomonas vulgaris]MBR7890256.1 hypothetical protein [Marinomonas vulgaris]